MNDGERTQEVLDALVQELVSAHYDDILVRRRGVGNFEVVGHGEFSAPPAANGAELWAHSRHRSDDLRVRTSMERPELAASVGDVLEWTRSCP